LQGKFRKGGVLLQKLQGWSCKMKKKFSTSWKSSKQTRKQRKYLANAPLHLRRKIMGANLSKELRKKYGKRSFPVRKEDEVKIMRGKSKGKTGKISVVESAKYRVAIEGIQRKKKDGTKINMFFHCSNLQITKLNLDDRKRLKSLERGVNKKKIEVKTDVKPKKTEEKVEEKK